ncbi:MAG: hypothetical protein LUC85_11140 [Bacteroidales bacterium]|nr:hypothetical protein [Bacteroidales bacterium]MCD8395359.1 hypothetical protein [Bacteroidales bacterium]
MRKLINISNGRFTAIKELLNTIASDATSVSDYQSSFFKIGVELGLAMQSKFAVDLSNSSLLACASEDADWLASGFLEGIKKSDLPVAVFWSIRKKLSNGIDISPIVREYRDEVAADCQNLFIVKSIISSSCVVKTQLTRLMTELSPKRIFIIAPVMFKDAEDNLRREFPHEIASRFQFLTFAIDDERQGMAVVPGVGGMVYGRLGLGDEESKNAYIPEIVKKRL